MNIQDWLTQLLARPAADPLDWESYSVTMEAAIWKALWRDIDATQAYEDGLEAGFRLLQATHQHRSQLRPKDYHARQVLLCGSILAMLDKADRWEAYLAAWETIRAHTRHCVPARGHTLRVTDPLVAAFVQRADGGFGVPPLAYAMSLPEPSAVHSLARHLRRKTRIERKLEQERTGRLVADRPPMGRNTLTVEAIQARLAQLGQPAPQGRHQRGRQQQSFHIHRRDGRPSRSGGGFPGGRWGGVGWLAKQDSSRRCSSHHGGLGMPKPIVSLFRGEQTWMVSQDIADDGGMPSRPMPCRAR